MNHTNLFDGNILAYSWRDGFKITRPVQAMRLAVTIRYSMENIVMLENEENMRFLQ